MSNRNDIKDVQAWLVDACGALGLRIESADSDFFEAGGTSITAVKLLSRVEGHFGEDALTPEALFEQSRLSDIASHIVKHGETRAS
ncbi:phosphopantetheine-binding protein [Burkholderia plantarii]|uniref:Carrier domain-containing protein n=1 Tax=Burkholderia plantarii TaxID=41899 RepID=A0A0B6RZU6_BURPL|nr:phosphopantetheine-binding protein [Burkholderia plantarii]AJK46615.1 hypothetical protein, acyl carrier protein-like, phosphopantheine binding domain protein [Burkholderia plantarii]ALK30738.1 hypothetical protein bpln_1g19490 [Burkholderia plantarii]WLE59453.1 acyl carrier protein [Burkholderia plantarii]GLZ19356.1 hypothetical protein Bpla01_28860 [Burkholderia plantarii]